MAGADVDGAAAERLAELEAENSRLRAELDRAVLAERGETAGDGSRHRRGRWRTPVAVVCIVLGALLAPVAVIAGWAKTELTDTDAFVATFSPLADDPAVQSFVAAQVATAIDEQLDIEQLTGDLVDGIVELGTGPAATRALQALKGPAADGIRSLVNGVVERFVASDAFSAIWTQALRITHAQAIAAIQGDEEAAIDLGTGGEIGVQLGPIVEAAKSALIAQGIGIAQAIPVIDRTVVVAQSDAVGAVRLSYNLATIAGAWLPWAVLAILAAGVLVARRPSRGLLWAAVAFAVSMALLAAGFGITRAVFLGALPASTIPTDSAEAIFDQLTLRMRDTAVVGIVLGLVVGLVGWLAGPFRLTTAWRGAWASGVAGVRGRADERGIGTGRFGSWLDRQARIVRLAVLVIAAAVIVFVRPLSVSLVVWTLVLAVLAIVLLELLRRPPASDEVDSEETVIPA